MSTQQTQDPEATQAPEESPDTIIDTTMDAPAPKKAKKHAKKKGDAKKAPVVEDEEQEPSQDVAMDTSVEETSSTSESVSLPGSVAAKKSKGKKGSWKKGPVVGKKSDRKSITKSERSGIVFPVGRIARFMRKKDKLRLGSGAPIYMAAALEYIAAEVLELAGTHAKNELSEKKREEGKKRRITPRHIKMAFDKDDELFVRIFSFLIFSNDGTEIESYHLF